MWQRLKNTLIYWILWGLRYGIRWVPHCCVLGLGGFLGAAFFAWVPRERKRALHHLALALPELSLIAREALARNVFAALGRNALEFLKMLSLPTEKIVAWVETVQGSEHMEKARAQGRGVLCLTAHLGNWEILPIFTQQHGWPCAVVAQKLYDARLDQALNKFRESHGVQVIQRRQVTREIIKCLRKNMLLGILNDQDTEIDSCWAPFFNQPAKTPIGIFRLAKRTGAVVVPIFIVRQSSGKHQIMIEPALDCPTGEDEEKNLYEWAKQSNQIIEAYIRRFPEQWVWFHQRWKHAPP